MTKINFYHSLIFFNLCITLAGIEYLREGSFLIISLFLILTIGISHGSLDHIKGKKLIKYLGYKSISVFYLGYISCFCPLKIYLKVLLRKSQKYKTFYLILFSPIFWKL